MLYEAEMSEEERQYFTVAEANTQLRSLGLLFSQVMQLRGQLKVLYAQLDDSDCAPSEAELVGEVEWSDEGYSLAQLRDRHVFAALVETLRERVADIEGSGCIIKDIETGLVDWPALHDGREVLLCWRYGETCVTHWHEVDSGFSGRRPVAELGNDSRVH